MARRWPISHGCRSRTQAVAFGQLGVGNLNYRLDLHTSERAGHRAEVEFHTDIELNWCAANGADRLPLFTADLSWELDLCGLGLTWLAGREHIRSLCALQNKEIATSAHMSRLPVARENQKRST